MKRLLFAIIASLVVYTLPSRPVFQDTTQKHCERSIVSTIDWPAVQDSFAGVSFGTKYVSACNILERKYPRLNLKELGDELGVHVTGFKFAGFTFDEATFYTEKEVGFYRIIMISKFRTEYDQNLIFKHYLSLLKEKYGEKVMVEEDTAYYLDLDNRSVYLSREKTLELTLIYSDDTLRESVHKKNLNEI